MELNLRRPLAFIDIETTGINVSSDRIVEISILKIDPNGKEEWISLRINPEMPIAETVKLIQQEPTGLLAVNHGEGRINLLSADDIMNYLHMRKQLGF